jgi:hypothetical protein
MMKDYAKPGCFVNKFQVNIEKGDLIEETSLGYSFNLLSFTSDYLTRDISGCFIATLVAKRVAMAMKETAPMPMNTNVMIPFSFQPAPLR